ncbi:MAG: hypothetical protein ACI4OR_01215 [Alphaproteobacteria bacterium]
MKKTLISLAALMISMPVMAAENCAYSPLQNLIRNVRNADEIVALMNRGVVFSEKTRCGGSLMQLAVLRGNPQVLQALLNQDPTRANEMVNLQDFPIAGAPNQVPLILFTAYYAPNDQIVRLLVNAGADASKTDERGRNLLWYMEQNAVLRNTDLYDELNDRLLSALVPTQQNHQIIPLGGSMQLGNGSSAAPKEKTEQKPVKASVVEATQN